MNIFSQTPSNAAMGGIVNVTTVMPPPNTPAPYDGPYLGMLDGASPATASKNMAWVYEALCQEIVNAIKMAGLVPDKDNWAQLGLAVQAMIKAAMNQGAATTGAAVTASVTLSAAQMAQDIIDIDSSGGALTVTIPDVAAWPANKTRLILQWVGGTAAPTLAMAAGDFAAGTPAAAPTVQYQLNPPAPGYAPSITLLAVAGGVRIV